jgi:hypothetical protein
VQLTHLAGKNAMNYQILLHHRKEPIETSYDPGRSVDATGERMSYRPEYDKETTVEKRAVAYSRGVKYVSGEVQLAMQAAGAGQ